MVVVAVVRPLAGSLCVSLANKMSRLKRCARDEFNLFVVHRAAPVARPLRMRTPTGACAAVAAHAARR